ncbi:MAG: peptidase C13 [Alphaproteobacteria bacterium]|nr:peptidase C13 [Alphaproteobacteria bacterium]
MTMANGSGASLGRQASAACARLLSVLLLVLFLPACGTEPAGETLLDRAARLAPPFAEWKVLVMAGDATADTGAETLAFDNARADIVVALERVGFAPERITQASVHPDRFPGQDLKPASLDTLGSGLSGPGRGCLLYLTSHGTPGGVVVGSAIVTPAEIHARLSAQCVETDPVVMIVSACYSGIFVRPEMSRWNRFILTAAREDRPSFGCGESDRYPYFDACVLEAFPQASGFADLAERTRACVAAKEAGLGLVPSEPQLRIGAGAEAALSGLGFPAR